MFCQRHQASRHEASGHKAAEHQAPGQQAAGRSFQAYVHMDSAYGRKGEGLMQLYTVQCSGRYTVRTQMYSAHVVCVAQMYSAQADEPQHTKPLAPGAEHQGPGQQAAGHQAPGLRGTGLQASGVTTAKATSMLLAPTKSCSWRGYWGNLGPVADGGAGQTPVLRVPPLVHGLRAVRSGEAANG